MKYDHLLRLLDSLYAPENLIKVGVEDPVQFTHQPAVIAGAWQRLVERKQIGVVLADEVGLGKTYEALGVMFFYLINLLSREKRTIFRVLIVLPPKLITKWRDELEHSAEQIHSISGVLLEQEQPIADSVLRALADAQELTSDKARSRLLVGGRVLNKNDQGVFLININKLIEFTGIEQKGNSIIHREFIKLNWDMIIMDEAHNYTRSDSDKGSQRGRAARVLSSRVQTGGTKILLCTATPFQLDTSELVNLLGMIEPRPRVKESIQQSIEAYNNAIVELKQLVENEVDPDKLINSRLKAKETKDRLETLLRPYILRSRRPEKEGIETRRYTENPIATGTDFPWLYWQVREWTRQLAHAPDVHLRTFLPNTMQTALSSYMALEEHLDNFGKKHGRKQGEYNITRRQLISKLKSRISKHPKHEALENFIKERIDNAAHNFTGSLDDLSNYKCVIFANRKRTIQALSQIHNGRGTTNLAEMLSNRIRIRKDEMLKRLGIDPEAFKREYNRAINRFTEQIRQEYIYTIPGKPDIWDTPYYSEVENEFIHIRRIELGIGEDLSTVLASEIGCKSIFRMFLENFGQKMRESLNQFEFVSKLSKSSTGNLETWKEDLQQLVNKAADRRVRKPLNVIQKFYTSNDQSSGQLRERLRLRLSRLAYSLSPREVIEDLSGEVDFPTRQQIIDSFNYDLYPLILICSAVAEEGIDLQKRCNTVIHYDLEWNPAKVEQREGRVDRLGRSSSAQVEIITYKLSETYDERILARCQARKIWMELYLCKTWREEGQKLEEEAIHSKPEVAKAIENLEWLREYRLNLKPDPIIIN
jgi:superfamily II DNA/RNA helicase